VRVYCMVSSVMETCDTNVSSEYIIRKNGIGVVSWVVGVLLLCTVWLSGVAGLECQDYSAQDNEGYW
jgi:hypothetical protein